MQHKNFTGFHVVAFPCNQWNQETRTEPEIKKFAEEEFELCVNKPGCNFHLMSKVEVNGKRAHPVFKYLKQHSPPAKKPNPHDEWKHDNKYIHYQYAVQFIIRCGMRSC